MRGCLLIRKVGVADLEDKLRARSCTSKYTQESENLLGWMWEVVLKHLSQSNFEFEKSHIQHVLGPFEDKFKFTLVTVASDSVYKGKNSKNKSGEWTVVARFENQPRKEIIAELGHRIHTRFG